MEDSATIGLPRYRNPGRDRRILEGVLLDKSSAEIAAEAGCTSRTVRRVKQDNARWLDDRRRELQAIAVERMHERIDETMGSLLDSANDPENRSQPQCARVAGELSGLIGKGPLVHVGDVYNQSASVQVNAKYAAAYDPELEADLRRELGLEPSR